MDSVALDQRFVTVDEKPTARWHDLVGHRAYGRPLAPSACAIKFTELTITKIAAENGLVGARLGWVLTLNGLLFASYAVTLNSTATGQKLAHLADFQRMIAFVGLVTGLISLAGLWAAYSAINSHKRRWLANQAKAETVAVQPFGTPLTSLLGRLPSFGMCTAIAGVWAYLLLVF